MTKSEVYEKKRVSACKSIVRLQAQVLAFAVETTTEGELELASIGAKDLKEKLDQLQDKAIEDLDAEDYRDNHEKDFETMFKSMWSIQVKVNDFVKKKGTLVKKTFPNFKLERISIPKFSGQFTDWQSFHDLFKSSIDENATLSGAEKMVHLKSCLIGEASSIVACFTTSDTGYKDAWELVVNRYSNKREIVFSHLKKFDEVKPLQQESASGLRSLADAINECSRSLKINSVPVEHWDLVFIFFAAKKLDATTRKEWLLKQGHNLPKLKPFIDFIESRARAISDSSLKPHGQSQASSTKSHHSQGSVSCPKCNQSHHLYKCKAYKELTIEERKNLVQRLRLCFKCLFKGHGASNCPTKFSCSKCGGGHHISIHQDRVSTGQSTPVPPQSEESASSSTREVLSAHSGQEGYSESVLLGTLRATVQDSNGRNQPVRIFMDVGSEENFVSNHFTDRIGIRRKRTCVGITGISGSIGEPATGVVKFRLKSNVSDYSIEISSLVVRKITNKLPRVPCQREWAHLKGISFGDPSFNYPGHVDILLGAGVISQILIPGLRVGPAGSPTGQNTKFGWVIFGNTKGASHTSTEVYSNHVSCSADQPCLESTLTRFWTLEEPEQSPTRMVPSKEDLLCESHFVATHQRDEDGRYMVELPFKSTFELGHSRAAAVDRFLKFEKRLHNSFLIKKSYLQTFRQSIQDRHMELVPSSELGNKHHFYLPHHAVLKLLSSTTKVRVVYDASMKSSNGKSLNDVLLTGLKIQIDLIPLLLRFRTHRVAVSADIVRFYNQFKVNPQHCDYQRLVWRESPEEDLQDYRLLRVTFGVTSAPYLSIRCLHQLAEDERE